MIASIILADTMTTADIFSKFAKETSRIFFFLEIIKASLEATICLIVSVTMLLIIITVVFLLSNKKQTSKL